MSSVFSLGALVAGAVGLLTVGIGTPATAQEMKEEAVKVLMDYAWSLTPDRFTKPDGSVIEVDRSKRAQVEVPLDAAREVIKAGRLSAHAQTCDLKEEHLLNYRTFMFREEAKHKWSEQQMLFMNQLHLVTVMLLTGKLTVVEHEDGKEVTEDASKTDIKSCTPEQKAKVAEAVLAFLNAGPVWKPNSAAANPAAGGPAPTPAAVKK